MVNWNIYARRSSDSEDRQAMSIKSQVAELRTLAAARGIEVAEELTESASAREPSRPVFNRLMKSVREGKVTGILVWRLDMKFALALQFGAAAKYTDDLSAAVKRGNRHVLEDSKVPGSVPLGYVKTHEHERVLGTVVPDPERFDIVKRFWKEFLAEAPSVSAVWRKARYE